MKRVGSLVFRKRARQNPAIAATPPSDPANSSGAQRLISNYFVCVGAQKAGTTWLLATLGRHPDIFTTPVKEIHYFDHVRGISSHLSDRKRRQRLRKYLQRLAFDWRRFADYRRQWAWYQAYMQSPIDDAWYENLFDHRGGAIMAGEATPEYAILGEEGFRHIKRLAPDARAIFVLRNPLRQAWSQFLHFEHKKDARAVRRGTEGAIAFWESPYSAPFRDYVKTMDELVGVFGSDRVKFLFFEDIHADRRTAIKSLCEFLAVEFQPDYFGDLEQALNVSRLASMPADLRHYLVTKYRPVVAGVAERMGTLPSSWRDDFSLPLTDDLL